MCCCCCYYYYYIYVYMYSKHNKMGEIFLFLPFELFREEDESPISTDTGVMISPILCGNFSAMSGFKTYMHT